MKGDSIMPTKDIKADHIGLHIMQLYTMCRGINIIKILVAKTYVTRTLPSYTIILN